MSKRGQPKLPRGFWVWLAKQDPERVPFRPFVTDPELGELVDHAHRVAEGREGDDAR